MGRPLIVELLLGLSELLPEGSHQPALASLPLSQELLRCVLHVGKLPFQDLHLTPELLRLPSELLNLSILGLDLRLQRRLCLCGLGLDLPHLRFEPVDLPVPSRRPGVGLEQELLQLLVLTLQLFQPLPQLVADPLKAGLPRGAGAGGHVCQLPSLLQVTVQCAYSARGDGQTGLLPPRGLRLPCGLLLPSTPESLLLGLGCHTILVSHGIGLRRALLVLRAALAVHSA
mmetsp:Transcript_34977/g.82938  ORF Transcript_34977/g.82938 Transcript_34977/m.82938 type:complete len:229 (-) Transcript_34977:1047-1733(-)